MRKATKRQKPSRTASRDTAVIDARATKLLGRGLRSERRLPLRVLREGAGMTQAELARVASMDQSEISRIEQRDDMKLSTLRRYARALEAGIEVTAVLKTGHRIRLDLTRTGPG